MKSGLASSAYTNAVLTIIAIALGALALPAFNIDGASRAQAQMSTGFNNQAVVTPSTSVPQSMDVAVAAATNEVAKANADIAAAIRELAKSVDRAASALQNRPTTPSSAAAGTGSPSTGNASGIEMNVR